MPNLSDSAALSCHRHPERERNRERFRIAVAAHPAIANNILCYENQIHHRNGAMAGSYRVLFPRTR